MHARSPHRCARLAALSVAGLALLGTAPAHAAGTESDPPTIPGTTLAPLTLGGSGAKAGQASAAAAPTASAGAAYEKAKTLIAANDFVGAIASLEEADRLQPNNADVQNLLGYSNRKAGNMNKALTHYANALKLNPSHRGAHEYLGEAYLVMKKPAKAKAELAALAKICGKSCEEYLDLSKSIAAYSAKKPVAAAYK